MSDQEGIYARSVVAAERDRLTGFIYPNTVSRSALEGLEFNSLIDAGAGLGTGLAKYVVRERKAKYVAFDLNPGMVTLLSTGLRQENIPARVLEADILNIPQEVGHADVIHERFVLMHLDSDAKRQQALAGLLAIADRNVVLLEYDWMTMGSSKHADIVGSFRNLSLEFMLNVNIDPFAGRTMQFLVNEVIPTGQFQFLRDQRPEGDYTEELIVLCNVQKEFAAKLGMPILSGQFANLGKLLASCSVEFTPPVVNIAIIQA